MLDDARARAQQAPGSLHAVRYEDTLDGLPPRRVNSVLDKDQDKDKVNPNANARYGTPPRTSASQLSVRSELSSDRSGRPSKPLQPQHQRPRTSPSPRPRAIDGASLLSDELKRDSGIAPSVSTSHSASSLKSVPNAAGGAAKEPTLPTIVVQDEEPSGAADRSRVPFGRRKTKEKAPRQAKSQSPPRIERMPSFKGIETTIPSVSADDINLDDLASDKITFSNRGSLMFGGKKMQELIAAKGRGEERPWAAGGRYSPVPAKQAESQSPDVGRGEPVSKTTDEQTRAEEPAQPAQNGAPSRPGGLVAGRRKPSVQMLQAALQGGRVLSAEEITFSMKVRSMYEHGDERAAEWMGSLDGTLSKRDTPTPDPNEGDSHTPEPTNGIIHVNKTRMGRSASNLSSRNRSSVYQKDPKELAGGIEDWDHVDSRNVDRYGFIRQERATSRASGSSPKQEGFGMQRVATSLRVVEPESPRNRKLTRGTSSARSSRSVPPRPSNDWTVKKGPASVHSTHSHASATRTNNPFRSRTKKTLAEAPDMLFMPPGLADIDEEKDAGRTASNRKQKEWSREEKWQKMARPVRRPGVKGGGMRFEFDTNDSKLIERTWKGIPDRWRATAWHSFLSASARKRRSSATDEELIGQFHKLQEESSADDVQIDVDVPRTVTMHIMFRRRYRGGQRLLFRVLHAVSLYFPDTGYVQGMASLAATFLCYYDEENAFVMMVRLWQLRGLEQLFQSGFAGLLTCLSEFEQQWLQEGDVATHLANLGIGSTAYGTRWYLTLFNMSVPFPAQLRVWDVFLLLGDEASNDVGAFGGADLDVLHATSAALIDATREILLDSDFENAMKVLTSWMPIKDEDVLMRVARTEWKMKKKRAGERV